jgi:ferrous iron transport protein A
MNLSELEIGQKALIDGFMDLDLSLRLLEMGCLPGEKVEISNISPLGCPIAINIAGYKLSIRKKEAATIRVSYS